MAHWAQLDENNVVIGVSVGNNEEEDEGYQWLIDNIGGTHVKTSYNTWGNVHYNPETGEPSEDQSKAFRKNYATVGGTYDPERDAFIPPKPFDSWILNEETCQWEAPSPRPTGDLYEWNEDTLSWELVD